jgi:N-acylneuraminate cytidylyltransferase
MADKFLGIIPARSGSKGLPNKNIKLLKGKPLLAWTIEEALSSKYLEQVIVSTDSSEIAQIAINYGALVPFLRPKNLATDESPTVDTVLDLIKKLPNYDYVVLLQPTSPLRTIEDIDSAIDIMKTAKAKALVSVCESDESPYWMYKMNANNILSPLVEATESISRRQDLPKSYTVNGAIYVAHTDYLLKNKSFFGAETLGYVMEKEKSFDIDTADDFKEVEMIIERIYGKA